MFKSVLGSLAYGLLRQRAPLFFTAIDLANAFIPKQNTTNNYNTVYETIEPEIIQLVNKCNSAL